MVERTHARKVQSYQRLWAFTAEWGRNVGVCHSIQLSYERIYEINGEVPVIAF